MLVVPVQFSDAKAADLGFTIDAIKQAFLQNGVNDYVSVYDYFLAASYGQLTLDITVLDEWFTPKNNSSYYLNATMDYFGDEIECGDQLIIDEILQYLDNLGWDLSDYDSDHNGCIDAIVMVNTLDIDPDVTMQWAYRYWNLYTDDDGYYYEYDGVSANDYLWASYQFLFDDGYNNFDDKTLMNTYTFIHEFSHVLGVDDYYDYSYESNHPMDGYDVMDSMIADHNAFSKINLGWLTNSKLIVTDSSVTIDLDAFAKAGDTIILANDWDEKLGAYQEYYIIVYYTNDGLNAGGNGLFEEEGILVYHINASLYGEEYDGEMYYDIYNNNTDASDENGTEDNLIEYVKNDSEKYIYGVGDSLSTNVKDDSGEALGYTFTVNSLDGENASITFTKLN